MKEKCANCGKVITIPDDANQEHADAWRWGHAINCRPPELDRQIFDREAAYESYRQRYGSGR
jgi:hypothetical protein